MNEREIKDAFSSKLLVSLAREQPGETVLSIPGYVFLGCPFDVAFRFAGARGRVRINLTEAGNLLGHHDNGITGYGTACKLIDRRLKDMFGPGQARGAEKSWAVASADVTSGGADAGGAHVTFARHADTQQRAQELRRFERHSRHRDSGTGPDFCNGNAHYMTGTITPFTDARD
jgi:hypothetical protein